MPPHLWSPVSKKKLSAFSPHLQSCGASPAPDRGFFGVVKFRPKMEAANLQVSVVGNAVGPHGLVRQLFSKFIRQNGTIMGLFLGEKQDVWLYHMGVSLNGGTPKKTQNDHF